MSSGSYKQAIEWLTDCVLCSGSYDIAPGVIAVGIKLNPGSWTVRVEDGCLAPAERLPPVRCW